MFTFRFITTLLVHIFIALIVLGLLCKYFHLIGFFLIKWKTFPLHVEVKSWHFELHGILEKLLSSSLILYKRKHSPKEDREDYRITSVSQLTAEFLPGLPSLLHSQMSQPSEWYWFHPLKGNCSACWKPFKEFFLNFHITHWHLGAHITLQRLRPVWRDTALELGRVPETCPVPTVFLFSAGSRVHPGAVREEDPRDRGRQEGQGSSMGSR